MNLALIGFGRMGGLIYKHLKNDFNIKVFDENPEKLKSLEKKSIINSPQELGEFDYVILCVPISQIESITSTIAPYLNIKATLIDTCSVKKIPLDTILNNIDKRINVLGTHPMFGPDSVKDTLAGCKIVLCPVRIDSARLNSIKDYLKKNNLTVIESTPDEHDQQISESLVLTHFIGRALEQIKARPLSIDTKGHRRLLRILETVVNDSWQLFEDMNTHNPYSRSKREEFIKALEQINIKLNQKDSKE
jgi:prephenate dehydrogenase